MKGLHFMIAKILESELILACGKNSIPLSNTFHIKIPDEIFMATSNSY